MTDRNVKVTLDANVTPYVSGMAKAADATTKVDKAGQELASKAGRNSIAWAAMGTAATVAGARMLKTINTSIAAASNLNESTSKMRVIFGEAAGSVEKFAQTSASSMGMSKRAAMDAASTMAGLGKAAGLTGGELTKFSTDMVGLSADLASFFNTSPEEAMAAIASGLRGESEPLRAYNVLLDDATLKQRAFAMHLISSTKDALTPQTRALAAQAEILAQTTDAQGDYARTADGLANSQRNMNASLENARAAFGEALLPVMTMGVEAVTALAEVLADLPDPVQNTVAGLGLLTAVVLTVTPAILGASTAITAYTGAAAGAAGATGALATAIGALRVVAGPLAAILAVTGAAVYGIHQSAEYQRGKGIDRMTEAMKAATAAGRDFGDEMSVTLAGGEVVTGIDQLTAALGRSELVAGQVAPAFAALDSYLSSLSPEAARAVFDGIKDSATAAGVPLEQIKALLPEYMDGVSATAAANAAAAASEQEKTAAINAAADAMRAATSAAYGYINANLAQAGRMDALTGQSDRLRASLMGTATTVTGGSKASTAASKAETEATQKTIDALRKKDSAQQESEIKAARRRAQRRADAAADAGARADVQAGVKKAIDTDKAAKAGQDINGTNQGNSVGEATGTISKTAQKKLDAEIEGIRKRHKTAIDAQVKALQGQSKAQHGANSAAGAGTVVYKDMSNALDGTTAAGLRNRDALRQEAGSITAIAQGVEDAAIAAGDAPAVAAKKGYDALVTLRKELVDNAAKAGFVRDQVIGYLDEIKFAPKDFKIMFKLVIDTAELDKVEARLRKIDIATRAAHSAEEHKSDPPYVAPVVPRPRTQDPKTGVYRAAGGEIYGTGSSTSDSVPIWASRGEYMVNAQQYAANRELVRAINNSTGPVQAGGGFHIGAVNVTESSASNVRRNVIDALAEAAYRGGGVR